VDIVSNGETVTRLRATRGLIENALEVVLGNLDVGELVVVIGVEVEVRDDVSEVLHNSLASLVARGVGRTHICGVFSDDVANGHLVLDHLIITLSIGNSAQILVRPGVAGYLMAFSNHALNDIRPLCSGVDSTFANVNTGNEEGCLETIAGKLVKDTIGVDVWSIIVCNSNGASLLASVNTSTSICYIALLWASIIASAGTTRGLVGVTSRAVVDETVGCAAVIFRSTTVSLP
jgi:hypothetical protein